MKTILTLVILMPLSSLAQTAHYKILEGKLHKGGEVIAEVLPDTETYSVKMNYTIKKKALLPFPENKLQGETVIDFPNDFRDERGYLELEKNKEMHIPDAEIKFIKRLDFKNYKDAYLAEVYPKNGKSKIDVIYHPEIPGVGWAKVEIIFLGDIPLLKNYQVTAELKEEAP